MPYPSNPPVRWREEHRQLRRRLYKFLWTRAELEWLATHIKDVPPDLEKIIHEKLRQASS